MSDEVVKEPSITEYASFNIRINRAYQARNPKVAFEAEIAALRKYGSALQAQIRPITNELIDLEVKRPFDLEPDKVIEWGARHAYLNGILEYVSDSLQKVSTTIMKMEQIVQNLSVDKTFTNLKYELAMVSQELTALSTKKPTTAADRDYITSRMNELTVQKRELTNQLRANFPELLAIEAGNWEEFVDADKPH